MPNTKHDFKGFDDYIEVFRAGNQTSSDGVTQIFSHADLDEMVNNHQPAPIVIGHPKTDAPAYGWSESLRRDGDVLLAKFSDVEPQFAKMVADKRFPNRSVRIHKTTSGWKLQHVGWLGAVPPAVEGLKPVQFSASDNTFDFVSDAYATGVVIRTFRRLRDFLIENFGQEKADRVVSDFDLEMLADMAAEQRVKPESTPSPGNQFHAQTNGDMTVPKTYTEEEIAELQRAAREEGKEAGKKEFASANATLTEELNRERTQRLNSEVQAHIHSLLDTGRLTPALATGMAEFMLALPAAEFEFSTGEGDATITNKKSALDWFKDFCKALPVVVDMNQSDAGKTTDASGQLEFHAPHGAVVNPERLALHNKAVQYMKDNQCDYVEAVIACEKT